MSNADSAPVSDIRGPVTWGYHLCGRQEQQLGASLLESRNPGKVVSYMCRSSFCYKPAMEKEISSAGPGRGAGVSRNASLEAGPMRRTWSCRDGRGESNDSRKG